MTARRLTLAAAATAAALLPVAAAHADATWSTPVDVVAAGDTIFGDLGIGFDAQGRGLVSWNFSNDPHGATLRTSRSGLRSIAPGDTLEGLRVGELDSPAVGRPVQFGADGVAALQRTPGCAQADAVVCRRGGPGRPVTLSVVTTTTSLGGGSVAVLPSYRAAALQDVDSGAAAMAGTAGGRLAVAYVEQRRGHDTLLLSERRAPGAKFARRISVAAGPSIRRIAIAYGPHDGLLIAYSRAGEVDVRSRKGTGAFGPADDLGSAKNLVSLVAGVAANGRAVVAFRRSTRTVHDGRVAAASVHGALRAPGAAHFAKPQALDATPSPTADAVRLGMAADGSTTLGWTSGIASPTVITTQASPSGRFAALSPNGAGYLGDVVVQPSGSRLVVWRAPQAAPDATTGLVASDVYAATTVSDVESDELVRAGEQVTAVTGAFDPQTGEPTVAWIGAGALRTATRTP
ncbi:MAG TPA: hypothetical protein VGF63_07205 [Solirubrobacteraceae bacterium]